MAEDYPKKVYQQKMRAYLDTLRHELDRIESHLEETDADLAADNPDKLLDKVHEMDNRAHDHLHEVEKTGPEGWEQVRGRLEAAWQDMMTELNRLENRVVEDQDKRGKGG